ncbi:hypothetical protein ACFLYT_01495 [Nanoarchaeota archaeon]
MIGYEDQLELFRLISARIKKNVSCYAFGGTAMMFYGYKTATKDIDLIFDSKEEKNEFVRAIEDLGYKKTSPVGVYIKEKLKDAPVMYTRGDERFDVFLNRVFRTPLTEDMKNNIFAKHDFIEKENTFAVNVLNKESIILLKSVTDREKDFDDIKMITEKESNLDWNKIADMAIELHKKGDSWVVLDLEKVISPSRSRNMP